MFLLGLLATELHSLTVLARIPTDVEDEGLNGSPLSWFVGAAAAAAYTAV